MVVVEYYNLGGNPLIAMFCIGVACISATVSCLYAVGIFIAVYYVCIRYLRHPIYRGGKVG